MEFCQGGQVNDRNYMTEHGINTREVSEKISKLYSEMIFVNGYVHCDPHPGNVLVKKNGNSAEIVLLDHGLYTVSLLNDHLILKEKLLLLFFFKILVLNLCVFVYEDFLLTENLTSLKF